MAVPGTKSGGWVHSWARERCRNLGSTGWCPKKRDGEESGEERRRKGEMQVDGLYVCGRGGGAPTRWSPECGAE